MTCEVEQIDPKQEEHVMVYCHNREASWVQTVSYTHLTLPTNSRV